MNELEFAETVRHAPQIMRNSYYAPLRISGTGVAYRPALDELVYRDPDVWLAPSMQRRVVGLPVVVDHPEGGLISSYFFGERCVGMLVTAFVKDDELWGTARIVDAYACELLALGAFDTSPSILLPPAERVFLTLSDGTRMLVEAEPEFIDHLALIYTGNGNKGVWTRSNGKGGEKA